MTNLENIANFLLEKDIETINNFLGKPKAINSDKKACDIDKQTREFLHRLSSAIKEIEYKKCKRDCILRKAK